LPAACFQYSVFKERYCAYLCTNLRIPFENQGSADGAQGTERKINLCKIRGKRR
jgi:hypothetical protein